MSKKKAAKRAAQVKRLAPITFNETFPHRADGLCRCTCGRQAVRTWASQQCQRLARETFFFRRGYSKQIRKFVMARDKGRCVNCGMDTEAERMKCHPANPCRLEPAALAALQAERCAQGFPSPDRSWWQADHIVPLIEGGGHEMDNLRTLCVPCHKIPTAELAGRRAKPPKL